MNVKKSSGRVKVKKEGKKECRQGGGDEERTTAGLHTTKISITTTYVFYLLFPITTSIITRGVISTLHLLKVWFWIYCLSFMRLCDKQLGHSWKNHTMSQLVQSSSPSSSLAAAVSDGNILFFKFDQFFGGWYSDINFNIDMYEDTSWFVIF